MNIPRSYTERLLLLSSSVTVSQASFHYDRACGYLECLLDLNAISAEQFHALSQAARELYKDTAKSLNKGAAA